MASPLPTPRHEAPHPPLSPTEASALPGLRLHPETDSATNLERLIRDGVAAGLSRRRLYRLVIDSQLKASFPRLLRPDDRRAAATLLLTDPTVRRLFDRLYSAA